MKICIAFPGMKATNSTTASGATDYWITLGLTHSMPINKCRHLRLIVDKNAFSNESLSKEFAFFITFIREQAMTYYK